MNAKGSGVRRRSRIGSSFQAAGRIAVAFLLIVAVAALPSTASAEPSLEVTIDHNYVNGWDFPNNTGLTLSVNGGVKGILQTTTDNNGHFGESWSGANVPNQWLLPGDTLTVSDGETLEVQMEIQNLHATVDRAGDRVLGMAKSPGGVSLFGEDGLGGRLPVGWGVAASEERQRPDGFKRRV